MQKIQKTLSTLLFLILILALTGCTPPAPPAPTPSAPTEDLAATAEILRAQLASTMVVRTQTAEALAMPPTSTIAASATPTPIPDTPTPTATIEYPTAPPTLTPTKVYATLAPMITSTPGPYRCSITYQKLKYGEHVTPGVDFDAKWTIKNIGTEDWEAGELYYQYESGTKFQAEDDDFGRIDKLIETGDKFNIIIDMFAPREPGLYHARWALYYNDGIYLCDLPVDVRVVP